jgi:CheY-like chemotaxis protein
MCLLARDRGNSNKLYRSLKDDWYALDDLTGKDFLFMFTGKYHEDDYHSEVVCDNHSGCSYALRNEYFYVMNRDPSLRIDVPYDFRAREERGKFTPDLPRNHTRVVSELRKLFELSEDDIPCLVFTNLHNGENIAVRFQGQNIYDGFRLLYIEIEPLLREIDTLLSIKTNNGIVNVLEKTDKAETIRFLKHELSHIAFAMPREEGDALRECIEHKKYGKFQRDIRRMLNQYVDLSKNYTEVAENVNKIDSLYSRIDKTIQMSADCFMDSVSASAPSIEMNQKGDNSVQIANIADGATVINNFYSSSSAQSTQAICCDKLKTLVLDDDVYIARSVASCLNDTATFAADYVTNVDDLFEKATHESYDVFVIDIMMDRGSRYSISETADGWNTGISVYTELKDKYPNSIIVASSGNALPHVAEFFDAREETRFFHKREFSLDEFPKALIAFLDEIEFQNEMMSIEDETLRGTR